MTTMARTLKEKMATLDPARRASVEAEADRLHTEYLTLQELRKAKEMTQVQLAKTLGIQQATVAKYERQSDLLLSTLTSYVEAMGGNLKLMVEFPGKELRRARGARRHGRAEPPAPRRAGRQPCGGSRLIIEPFRSPSSPRSDPARCPAARSASRARYSRFSSLTCGMSRKIGAGT
jgi:transcriptional regulator with XRE-family HTH domain